MNIPLSGHVDEQHRLSVVVPTSIPPGPVTVWIAPSQEDDAGAAWMAGVAVQWADELSDAQQDIYSLEDGDPVDQA